MRRSDLPMVGCCRAERVQGWALLLAVLTLCAADGCASSKMITVREVPRSPLVDRLKLTARGGPQPSERTMQFLRVYDLTEQLEGDPRELLEKVQVVIDAVPTAENVYAYAELAYLGGKRLETTDPKGAIDLYGASVLAAYRYLFDEKFTPLRNPYDPEFRGACDLYNGALESALRLFCKNEEAGIMPGEVYTIDTAAGQWDIECVVRGGKWSKKDFERFLFVSDYEMKGLRNHYETYGLGVPMIAVRRSYEGEPAAARYYPPDLSFPVTVFVRPTTGAASDEAVASSKHRAVLELYDPLVTKDVAVGRVRVPLQSDVTTPLAYFLSNPALGELANEWLFDPGSLGKLLPGKKQPITGLWMVQPYEPGKIPVIFVHGLWSSPMTWMETFNDLRSSPEICDHYQFWFYLYPTGQPFWISAAQMREDLAEMRKVLDPNHEVPELDQIVLIGHSMGGLVSRLQTLESADDFWRIVSDEPFSKLKADSEVRKGIEKVVFFHPNRSIRRVITIGTPHRGSNFANGTTQWLLGKLISLPTMLVESQEKIYRDNKELFRDDTILKVRTSIDSLSPESPFFPVMIRAQRAPWVKYNGIVGLVPEQGLFGKLAAGSDGVVTYESAHMDDVEAELKVPADHAAVHSHPRTILEIRRILTEHLAEMEGRVAYTPPVHVRMAALAEATDEPRR